jgi:ABC-type lipoprotein release transport system permease subunit
VRLWHLAVRNFWRHRQRYQVLLTLVALGAALSLVLVAVTDSLGQSLRLKAGQYFGGEVSVLGYHGSAHRIDDDAVVAGVLNHAGVPTEGLYRRTVSYNSETILFFKDHSLKQRRMIGVDTAWERKALERLDWEVGGPAGLFEGTGVAISRGTADKLRAEVGDEVTLLIDTVTGAKNTLTLKVTGIFHDTSFFGYSSYLSIETLNRALGLPPGTSTEMGVALPGDYPPARAAQQIHEALGRRVSVVPLLQSKSDLDSLQEDTGGVQSRYAVMTLDARLAQIQQILDALLVVSGVLNGLFLVIVAVGVGNTFRAVLVERTREIGVWRSLGMTRSRLVGVILAEVAVLAVAGGAVGLVGGLAAWTALTLVGWGNQALAAMFLIRGHLAWTLPWAQEAGLFSIMVAAGLAGALGPALRSAHWKPVDALRYHT